MQNTPTATAANGQSWIDSQQVCTNQGKQLCTFDKICPNGEGSTPVDGGSSVGHDWSPMLRADGVTNDWVHISGSGHSNCKPHGKYHGIPGWGTQPSNIYNHRIYCCDQPCLDKCTPTGGHGSAGCTVSYCDQYKSGGGFRHRCTPTSAYHHYAISECAATCGLCAWGNGGGMFTKGQNAARVAGSTITDHQVQLALKFMAEDRVARAASFCRRYRKAMGHYYQFPEIKDNPCPNDGTSYDQPQATFGTCYRRCVPPMVTCGREACASDEKACADKIIGFILGPVSVIANFATFGSGTAMAQTINAANTAVTVAVTGYNLASIVAAEIKTFMTEGCNDLAAISSSQALSQIVTHVGAKGTPNFQTVCRAYSAMFIASEMKAHNQALDDLQLGAIDPTGVVGMVQGYIMSDCLQAPSWPTVLFNDAIGSNGAAQAYLSKTPGTWRPPSTCRRRARRRRRRAHRRRCSNEE